MSLLLKQQAVTLSLLPAPNIHPVCRMVHGKLINNGTEFFITTSSNPDPDADHTPESADTEAVRDGGKESRPPDVIDVALMDEQDTYKDFHAAFVVGAGSDAR